MKPKDNKILLPFASFCFCREILFRCEREEGDKGLKFLLLFQIWIIDIIIFIIFANNKRSIKRLHFHTVWAGTRTEEKPGQKNRLLSCISDSPLRWFLYKKKNIKPNNIPTVSTLWHRYGKTMRKYWNRSQHDCLCLCN